MKNRDVLFDTIGEADEALIPELSGKKTGGRLRTWIALGGLCAAVIVCVILFSWKNENAIRVNFAYGMMGFEGVEVFELSELDTPNPWSPDLELAALPVYRNQMASRYINMARDNYPGVSVSITGEEMERIVQRTAAALHAEILDEKVTLVKDLDYAEKNSSRQRKTRTASIRSRQAAAVRSPLPFPVTVIRASNLPSPPNSPLPVVFQKRTAQRKNRGSFSRFSARPIPSCFPTTIPFATILGPGICTGRTLFTTTYSTKQAIPYRTF